MTELAPRGGTQDRSGTRRRFAIAAGLFVLTVAIGVGIFAAAKGIWPPSNQPRSARLTDVITQTIKTKGIDAGVAQYRSLRERGFPELSESESDTNKLGYQLLRQGDQESAIKVFQLNVETHPKSANVYDSLAEAYVAAGNKGLAIESYQKMLALGDPAGTAAGAIRRLRGVPLSSLALVHICGGTLGILSGFVAMAFRKGSRWHGVVGNIFFVSMLAMSADAAYLAFRKSQTFNVFMGSFTFYLVATAWSAARRRDGKTGIFDRGALLAAVVIAAGFATYGLEAANKGSDTGLFLFWGAVALLAAAGDLRMLLRGGVLGAHRIVRHLWRMCLSLFIAAGSLFLGQPHLFPNALRNSGVLFLPPLLALILMIFWLIRVKFTKAYKSKVTASPIGTALHKQSTPA